MNRFCIVAGALAGFLAVALGAYAAHGLPQDMAPQARGWIDTGLRYHGLHALALLAVGLLPRANLWSRVAAWAFLIGTLVFSGLLYVMAFTSLSDLGAMVPVGGLLLLLLGWAALIGYAVTYRDERTKQ
ncbi:MAG: DUF423 domain-containing protein [Rhodovibrionaceae bacterium]